VTQKLVEEPEKDVFEITEEGFFWLCDNLSQSGRLDDLPKPDTSWLVKYTKERRERAEALFLEWSEKWRAKRDKLAGDITDRLVASAP
jgi:hypothetical protein